MKVMRYQDVLVVEIEAIGYFATLYYVKSV